MEPVRILFVDDEPNLVVTMPLILRQHGYEVTAVSTVNEALTEITTSRFDALISDLNIGQPGDGFVVVSAMRRTQPKCITLILTGYPGFDTALQAIRSQVDDYLIKPTPVPTLINLIEEKLKNSKPGTLASCKRLSRILRENTFQITQGALKAMKSHPLLVLLCYKCGAPQKGQLESCRRRTREIVYRSVAIEPGLCRSRRTRRPPRTELGRNFGDG